MGSHEKTACGKASSSDPLLRREKQDPCSDFWHTLRIGVPIAVILFIVLPMIFQ